MVHGHLPVRDCVVVGVLAGCLCSGCGVGGQRASVAESRIDRIDQSFAAAKIERAEMTASVDARLAEVTTNLDATIHTETDGIPAWQMLGFLLGYFAISKGWNGWRHRRNGHRAARAGVVPTKPP